MTFAERIRSKYEDESHGTDEYGEMAKEALESGEIPDEYKSVVGGLLEVMSRDENKHLYFLKYIDEILSKSGGKADESDK